jgi:hypothetical protein
LLKEKTPGTSAEGLLVDCGITPLCLTCELR